MVTGSSASRVAARMGSAEFLAPEILTSPFRQAPPSIISLSIGRPAGSSAQCSPLFRGIGFDGNGMNGTAGDLFGQAAVNQLLFFDRRKSGKQLTHNSHLKIAAFAGGVSRTPFELLFQYLFYFIGLHALLPCCNVF